MAALNENKFKNKINTSGTVEIDFSESGFMNYFCFYFAEENFCRLHQENYVIDVVEVLVGQRKYILQCICMPIDAEP